MSDISLPITVDLKVAQSTFSHRVYPKPVIEQAIAKLPTRDGNIIAFGGFPGIISNGVSIDANHIAFGVQSIYFIGEDLKADIRILCTSHGAMLTNAIELKTPLHYTIQGVGNIVDNIVSNFSIIAIEAALV